MELVVVLRSVCHTAEFVIKFLSAPSVYRFLLSFVQEVQLMLLCWVSFICFVSNQGKKIFQSC